MLFIPLLARLVPKNFRKKIKVDLMQSTINSRTDSFIGWSLTLGVVMSFFSTIGLSTFELLDPLPMFLISFALFQFMVYMYLSLNISSKTSAVENALPDALQLMSSNIRAGLTTDKAMIMAARPEFGPLEKEIRRVGKETMAGRSLVESITRMSLHIRSNDLDRTIELITNSLRSGGELADLLDQTSADIREQQLVRKEISASVLMYVLFIFIAIALGAPALFSMSSFLVSILSRNMQMIADELPSNFEAMEGAPIKMSSGTISLDFIRNYALMSITASCFMGSMVMGLIMKGSEKEGIKYFFPMIIIAISLFFAATMILEYTIGGMMPD